MTQVTGSATVGGTVYPVSAGITLPVWEYTVALGHNAGPLPLDKTKIIMSNGSNTYVTNQKINVQAGTAITVYANSAQDWQAAADARPYGCTWVQTYNSVSQLTNNYASGTTWGGTAGVNLTPIHPGGHDIVAAWAESTPRDSSVIAEFAFDLWGSWKKDVMIWLDNVNRGTTATGAKVVGSAVIDGASYTMLQYGTPGPMDGTGGELVFSRDENIQSGTLNLSHFLDWLVANSYIPAAATISQIDLGWEICSAGNGVFSMTDFTLGVA